MVRLTKNWAVKNGCLLHYSLTSLFIQKQFITKDNKLDYKLGQNS